MSAVEDGFGSTSAFPPLTLFDGTICEVLNIFDVDGDELPEMPTDPADVHSVVAKAPDGSWIAQEVGPEMWQTAE